jgi:CBS domain containing-hemolysin-like protein
MVNDADAAVAWYTGQLGFSLLSNQAPAFADVMAEAESAGVLDAGEHRLISGVLRLLDRPARGFDNAAPGC